jgi:hypothetical protein
MIFARNPKITGSSQNDNAFLGSHDMFSEGQFTTIFGEEYQLRRSEQRL